MSDAAAHVQKETDAGLEPAGPRPGQQTGLVVFGVILSVLVALWVPRLMPSPARSLLSVSEQAEDLRFEAGLLVEEIDAFRSERGALPTPEQLGPYLGEGFEYEVLDERTSQYLVRRRSGNLVVTYDGTMSLQLWLLLGGSSSGGLP